MPETHDESANPYNWPDWVKHAGAETPASLSVISEGCERIRNSVKEGFIYEHVSQTQINAVSDKMVKDGVISKDGKILKGNVTFTKEYSAALIYQNRAAYQLLGVFICSKKMAIVHLIAAIRSAVETGNLLVAFICCRSIVENIAHFDSGIDEIRPYEVPAKSDEACKLLGEIKEKIIDLTYSTRVDWEAMIYGESEELIKRNKIKYKPNELRQDRTADSILGAIDHLNKKIKGIRGVYEILCEFAHPNVGLTFALTRSAIPILDKHGFTWVRKEISLDPPISAIDGTGKVINQIFVTIAKCVQHLEVLVKDAEEQRNKVQKISQVYLRQTLLRNKDILDPYALCPCGSTAKIKFCCGTSTH